MAMDSTDFPLVWMSFEQDPNHDPAGDLAEFEVILKRRRPFILLSDKAPAEGHEHSQDDRKRTSLWMKKHKAELRKLVLAMILIEPNAAKRLSYKSFGAVFGKFWGYPLVLASSREEGLEIANRMLSERDASETPDVLEVG